MPRRNDPNMLSSYATTVATDGNNVTRVTYHSTVIVTFNYGTVTLNTGGHRSATTKKKMNQAARQFNLGYVVFVVKGVWYVRHTVTQSVFTFASDTISFTRVGP